MFGTMNATLPTVQFEWDAERETWKNDENGVELEEATPTVVFRFTEKYPSGPATCTLAVRN